MLLLLVVGCWLFVVGCFLLLLLEFDIAQHDPKIAPT
jgi:hypothetical protein